MKKQLPCLLAAFVATTAASAEPVQHRAKIRKLEQQFQQSPQFEVDGVRDKRPSPQSWLEIEAEVEVETTAPDKFIPELRSKWHAIVMNKFTREPVRLNGEFTFKDIPTRGGRIHLVAYIHPHTLEKLTGSDRPAETDIEALALELSGPDIITTARHKPGLVMATAKEDTQWWKDPKRKSLGKHILPKRDTPFAPLWTDRYPQVIKE